MHKSIGIVVASLSCVIGSSAWADPFLGWAADGSFHALLDTEGKLVMCAKDCDTKPSWPTKATPSSPASTCVGGIEPLTDVSVEQARGAVVLPKPSAKGPGGATVKAKHEQVSADVMTENTTVYTVTLGKKKVVWDVTGMPKGQIENVYWKPDGTAVAVEMAGDGMKWAEVIDVRELKLPAAKAK